VILKGNISFALKGIALCGAVLVAGFAQAETDPIAQEDREIFVAAMISAGCLVGPDNAADVEKMTGFPEWKLTEIVDRLLEEGQIVPLEAGKGITLINEGCP